MAKPEVKVGQVWKEKDKRFTRYVRIDSFASKNGQPAAWCLTCDPKGQYRGTPSGTRIKISTLQSRFELVGG